MASRQHKRQAAYPCSLTRATMDGPACAALSLLVGCAVIVSAAAVTLGLSARRGMQVNAAELSPKSIEAWATFDRQQECIYRAIRSELPKGATVYIHDDLVYSYFAAGRTVDPVGGAAADRRYRAMDAFPCSRPCLRGGIGGSQAAVSKALLVVLLGLGLPGLWPAWRWHAVRRRWSLSPRSSAREWRRWRPHSNSPSGTLLAWYLAVAVTVNAVVVAWWPAAGGSGRPRVRDGRGPSSRWPLWPAR